MSVTIGNTDAQLSNKTLLTADANQTITGLKTFDRGTSAPMAVVSGAAKVTNLDADKLDGLEGAAYAVLANANAFTDATDATSISTGAIKTAGGLGITKALWVGGLANIAGAVTLQSTLDVTGAATLQSTLGVTGVATFTGDVLTVAQTDYYASSTITGWSSLTAGRRYIVYKKIGKMVFVNFHLEGASNSTAVSFTLPYTARTQYGSFGASLTLTYDNSAALTTAGIVTLAGGASTANCYSNGASGAWTAANNKIVSGSFWYWTD